MTDAPQGDTRCGFIAVVGAPNAGKSTLINAMVGRKVSIVSHKVQTTRMPVRGILVEGDCQLVLIDTPGICAPHRRLDQAMLEAAWGEAREADAVVLVVDAARGLERGLDEDGDRIVAGLAEVKAHHVLALNKIDRLRKERLLELARAWNARLPFAATFMISALHGDGLAELKRHLLGIAAPGPWHYGAGDVSDAPPAMAAAEITREKIYEQLHDELPYAAAVETTSWREQKNGVRIEQTIYVERDGQRAIVLGKGGRQIRQLSLASRTELARMLGKPVHLFLIVKVREGWADDPARYRDLGLTLPRD
jgi:GTP-binding protein Era